MDRKIHHFDSSGEAYDACQCDDDIAKGDLLIIASEGVVGIADTWPCAVTASRGELHGIGDWQATADHFGSWLPLIDAETLARQLGFTRAR